MSVESVICCKCDKAEPTSRNCSCPPRTTSTRTRARRTAGRSFLEPRLDVGSQVALDRRSGTLRSQVHDPRRCRLSATSRERHAHREVFSPLMLCSAPAPLLLTTTTMTTTRSWSSLTYGQVASRCRYSKRGEDTDANSGAPSPEITKELPPGAAGAPSPRAIGASASGVAGAAPPGVDAVSSPEIIESWIIWIESWMIWDDRSSRIFF